MYERPATAFAKPRTLALPTSFKSYGIFDKARLQRDAGERLRLLVATHFREKTWDELRMNVPAAQAACDESELSPPEP